MKQAFLTRSGPDTLPKALKIKESGDSVPKKDELQIRVELFGISNFDVQCRLGMDCPPVPCVLGMEVVGVVSEIGPEADADWQGKRVVAITYFNGYSDVTCVSQKQCLLIPDSVSFEHAISVPISYLSAWISIYKLGSIRSGDTILLGDAANDFSLAAIDIAKHMGAEIIGISSIDNQEFLENRGLGKFIESRANIKDAVMENTQNLGVDLILDTSNALNSAFDLLAVGGRIGIISPTQQQEPGILQKASSFLGLNNGFQSPNLDFESKSTFKMSILPFIEDPRTMEYLQHIVQGIEKGWVNPHIDKIFEFNHIVKAHQYVEVGCLGKVLVRAQ